MIPKEKSMLPIDYIELGIIPIIQKRNEVRTYTFYVENNVITIDDMGNDLPTKIEDKADCVCSFSLYNLDKNYLYKEKYSYEKEFPLCNKIDKQHIQSIIEKVTTIIFKQNLDKTEIKVLREYCVALLIAYSGSEINALLDNCYEFFAWIESELFSKDGDMFETILFELTDHYDTTIRDMAKKERESNRKIEPDSHIENDETEEELIEVREEIEKDSDKDEKPKNNKKKKTTGKRKWYQLRLSEKLFLGFLALFFLISLSPKMAIRANLLTKGEYKEAFTTGITFVKEAGTCTSLYVIDDSIVINNKHEDKYYVIEIGPFHFAHIE